MVEKWNFGIGSQATMNIENFNIKLNYGLDRSKISLPYTTYKPKLGEIVLFNPRYVHAVKKSKQRYKAYHILFSWCE